MSEKMSIEEAKQAVAAKLVKAGLVKTHEQGVARVAKALEVQRQKEANNHR